MTRRERLENKLAKREEWAVKRKAKSAAAFDVAHKAIEGIPPGQPILVGHHSEKRHRGALSKHDKAMRRAIDSDDMAKHHVSKAGGIADQLDRSIFSDDENATEALRERIESFERQREGKKAINVAWRKAKKPAPDDTEGWQKVADLLGRGLGSLQERRLLLARFPYYKQPVPSYELSNLGGRITADKKRLKELEQRAKEEAACEEAGGVLISRHPEVNWCRVRFAEKPEREVIQALKAAGYGWGSGKWSGYLDKLPESVAGLD